MKKLPTEKPTVELKDVHLIFMICSIICIFILLLIKITIFVFIVIIINIISAIFNYVLYKSYKN